MSIDPEAQSEATTLSIEAQTQATTFVLHRLRHSFATTATIDTTNFQKMLARPTLAENTAIYYMRDKPNLLTKRQSACANVPPKAGGNMENTQFIKSYRLQNRMSQRALAAAVGLSQQHIQRLECGTSPVSLKIAVKMSAALDVPLSKAFPFWAHILKKFPSHDLDTDKSLEGRTAAELEANPNRTWTAEFCWNAGHPVQFPLPSVDKDRLSSNLCEWDRHFRGSSEIHFFRFDSDLCAICVNLGELVYSRLRHDDVGLEYKQPVPLVSLSENDSGIQVWLRDQSQALDFGARTDVLTPESEGRLRPEPRRLRLLFDELECNIFHDEGFVSFPDKATGEVFLRAREIALIAIPHRLLNPGVSDETKGDCG